MWRWNAVLELLRCSMGNNERDPLMSPLKGLLALVGMSSVTLFGTPAFAVEPDIDSAAGLELPAPRTDRPDFQLDDQSGAALMPETEGADPRPPAASIAPRWAVTEPAQPIR